MTHLVVLHWSSSVVFHPGGSMRGVYLLTVSAVVAGVLGCGSPGPEESARAVSKRDLTLMTHTLEVKTASRVEMQPARNDTRAAVSIRQAPRKADAPRPVIKPVQVHSPVATPAPSLLPVPVAQPEAPASDRELLPGKTVTLIPAGSGPSPGRDMTEEFPEIRGRAMVTGGGGKHGGRGRGRGPGIGIGAAPRPDFR
jgi:hypothetical protein